MFFSNYYVIISKYHFQKKVPGILGKMADSKWSKKCMRVSSIYCDKKVEIYQRLMVMASGPITSWERDGETVETLSDFIFLGSKITADGDCSHEIKRNSLEGKL